MSGTDFFNKVQQDYSSTSSARDTAGRLRVSEPFGVLDNKNISTSNPNQWHEEISGAILEYTTLVGTFTIGELIRGVLPTEAIPDGTITADTGTALTIDCSHNRFQTGDTITGQTSGATAVLISTDTGSDIQHNYNRASTVLRAGTGAGDYAIRQSVMPSAYVSGKGQDNGVTFIFPPQKANAVYRAGPFNNEDGLYYEVTETDVAFVIRSSTSGSPDSVRIPQSEWNIDRLDGSGETNPSGKKLDPTKIQLFAAPYLWQGAGPARFSLIIDNELIVCHELTNANVSDVVYFRNPSLPIRYEVRNVGATASTTEIEEICSSASSEGGYYLPGLEFSVSMGVAPRTVSARTPVLAIRLKNQFPVGKKNIRIARFLNIGSIVGTNDALLEIAHIHDPIDITATWVSVSNGSAVEYSTNITTVTGRPEHIIEHDYVPTGQANKPASTVLSSEFISVHSFIAQNFDSTNSQMFVVYATPFTGSATVATHMTWIEFE